MLVLGVPGVAATAMLLGSVIMQGWVPGPIIKNKKAPKL